MALKIVSGSREAPLAPLLDCATAVLGYGNQGRAHALNLRDSGVEVVVGAREGTGRDRALAEGFTTRPLADAAAAADLVILALPDEIQGGIWSASLAAAVRPGATVGFLHGFAIRFGLIEPPAGVGVVMVAPKGPGATLRSRFDAGGGIPCLLAVHQDPPGAGAEALALAWANGIGCARAGIIYTSFADETETDLFGEQVVLCGGLTALMVAAFETLVAAGYAPELAYLECCHEVKQIGDLLYERGLAGMMKAISNTAEFGAYRAGPTLVDAEMRQRMETVLQEIRGGVFAEELGADHARGFPWFETQRRRLAAHPAEPAGEVIRALMRGARVDSKTTGAGSTS